MRLTVRALGLLALVAMPAAATAQTASQHLQLALGNYTLSALAQFGGKVVRGENVGRAARRAAVEALPAAGLQHAGMTLLGRNWRLALPAQALVQKGTMLQRRSILGQPLFADFWGSWEVDYLWFNLRVDHGRPRLPRVNVVTVQQTFLNAQPAPATLDWGRSLATGVPTRLADRLVGEYWGAQAGQHVDLNRNVMNGTLASHDEAEAVYRHELEHTLQSIRGMALVDVTLRQDVSQSRPVGFLRYNSDVLTLQLGAVQAFLFNGGHALDHDLRFVEWEADSYAGRTTRSFQWR